MANSNEYMRKYMLTVYYARRAWALVKLGGKCSICNATEKLEIDHINPNTKSFAVSRLFSVSKLRFEAEIAKCQLLCQTHHIEKTAIDLAKPLARGQHGTLSAYRYCKCVKCKEAKRDWTRKYRRA